MPCLHAHTYLSPKFRNQPNYVVRSFTFIAVDLKCNFFGEKNQVLSCWGGRLGFSVELFHEAVDDFVGSFGFGDAFANEP